MPRFMVTSGTHYDPFTYEEALKPIQHIQEAHNATQDMYDTLNLQTEAIRQYITNNPGDSDAMALYNSYKEKLGNLQNNLWVNGVTPQTKQALSDARAGYSAMDRVKSAIENRQARSKEFWEAKHKNPDLVTGRDPGLYGLNDYLNNDRFGQDWYSYDSAQFEKDVAEEAKSRAKEMRSGLTDPNGVVTNPKLHGILTRVIGEGFTNQEVDDAGKLADGLINSPKADRNRYYADNNIDPVVQLLTESLINRYDATGIREADVEDIERQRLLNRGKSGLTRGILAPDIKDFTDPEYELEMKKRYYRWQKAQETPPPPTEEKPVQTYTREEAGGNYEEEEKQYNKLFKPNVRLEYNGMKIKGRAGASSLVYSEDLRRNARKVLGFDVGLDPTPAKIGALTPRKKFLTGEVEINGVTYETQYDPFALKGNGAVRIREKGDDTPWRKASISSNLTKAYNYYRNEFVEQRDFFKKERPDIYKEATITPDKQAELWEEKGLGSDVSIADYAREVFSQKEYSPQNIYKTYYVTRNGTDSGKIIERMAGYEYNGMNVDADKILKIKNLNEYRGTSKGIHLLDDNDNLSDAPVQPKNIFNVKDGKITNIREIGLTLDSVTDTDEEGMRAMFDPSAPMQCGSGYIICNTDNGRVAINVDEFKSDNLKDTFIDAQNRLKTVLSNHELSLSNSDREIDKIMTKLRNDIVDLFGYDFNTQTQGGTSAENKL